MKKNHAHQYLATKYSKKFQLQISKLFQQSAKKNKAVHYSNSARTN